MQKRLKDKLEKIEKDQLIKIIETLCGIKENERLLKQMLTPTKSGVDALVRRFSRCAEMYVSCSCSATAFDKMMDSMEPICAVINYADHKLAAYIISEVYQAAWENDLFEFDCVDFVYELVWELRGIIENDAGAFSEEELERYREIVGDE